MKKIISTCIALMVSAACSISAFAMEVPTNTTIQDLNGVRQYIKIYTVAPDTDPQSLIDDVFEYDGYTYTYSSMTKEERSYGVSSNTSVGCMEKVRFPGLVGSIGGSGIESNITNPIQQEPQIPSTSYQPSAYTSVNGMERKDGSIGTLKIPSLNINMKVWEGETNTSMAKGLGHYSSTSGWDGNIGVCGHNRGAKYTIGNIKNLKDGDTITYTTVYGTRTYEVVTVGFIKLHERSGTLTLTGSGRTLLELIFNGAIPSLSLSYHGTAIERRIRLSRLMLSAYQAGIDVFAPEVNVAREIPSLFLTSITRTRGRNSWGSSRVAAILSLGGIYYAAHYVCPGIGRMAVNDELAAFHNHTNFGKNTQRAFLFAGSSYESVIEELKNQDEKRNEKLIRYGEAYHCLHAPIHLLSCDETGAQQLQIMTVPDYRVKLTRLMLRSAYQPPPEDIAAWDGLYNGHPFVIGADMDLRRIDTAVRTAKQHGCLPIALAALESQGSAVLLQRYADPGCATVYKVTENALSELLGRAPNLYVPPRTQFLTEKGDVVDAPLIKAPGKAGGPHRK